MDLDITSIFSSADAIWEQPPLDVSAQALGISVLPPEVEAQGGGLAVWPLVRSTSNAFVVVLETGRIVMWGKPDFSPCEDGGIFRSGIKELYATKGCSLTGGAFAAVLANGHVVTWGDAQYGGDSSPVRAELQGGAQHIFTGPGFFAAVSASGAVVTWGDPEMGGDSSSASERLCGGVQHICSSSRNTAALMQSGRIVVWGRLHPEDVAAEAQLNTVERLYANESAYAAVLQSGRVFTWGDLQGGGDSSAVQDRLRTSRLPWLVERQLWIGHRDDSSCLSRIPQSSLDFIIAFSGGRVRHIVGTQKAFAALMDDGRIVTWGGRFGANSSEDSGEPFVEEVLSARAESIAASRFAFAAALVGGGVLTWGDRKCGGDSRSVQAQLCRSVLRIASTDKAFAALTADGEVVTWGSPAHGGDSSYVRERLLGGVRRLQATSSAFAAVLCDGRIVTWGDAENGGDSSEVWDYIDGAPDLLSATLAESVRCDPSVGPVPVECVIF